MKKLLSNYKYLLSELLHSDKLLILFEFLSAFVRVALPLLTVYLSSEIVSLLTNGDSWQRILVIIAALLSMSLLLQILNSVSAEQCQNRGFALRTRYQLKYLAKYMKTDYIHIESPEGIDIAQRASVGYNAGIKGLLDKSIDFLTSVVGIFSYGAVISMLHPFVAVVLLAVTVGNYYLMKYLTEKDYIDRAQYAPIDRKINYLIARCNDFTYSKDIRLFGMERMLISKIHNLLSIRLKINDKKEQRHFWVQTGAAFLTLIQSASIYIYLLYMVIHGELGASEFVLYLGVISGFSGWIVGMIGHLGQIINESHSVDDMRAFLELEDESDKPGISEPPNTTPEIKVENLSFGYTEDRKILNDLSFTVKPGEKIALVGLNGAGKTTLVKLLCGIYTPDSGKIVYGGTDIADICTKSLFSVFSVVFQDIYLLPVSIAKNITLSAGYDEERLHNVIEMSGLDSLIARLPNGINTLLVKSVHEDAVELSGGEIQKLAIARALYKNGNVMILDEPTAALDPIAEDQIYQKFSEMTEGKTAIFISHRLASTRFCDKIYLLKNGKIAESGTHDELIAIKGEYYSLFETQSKYYREGESRQNEELFDQRP